MSQNIRFCTSSDGVKLAYAVSGKGPPLAMSNTWLTHLEHQWNSLAWKPWLEEFSVERTMLRYDARGCGLSDRDVGTISFEAWVSDFESVVDAAGFKRFPILATCWGGPIAIAYAARHPERVSRLILYGTYATNVAEEVEKARIMLGLTELGWGRENHSFMQVWATQFQPGGTLEHLHSWCEHQRLSASPAMAHRLLEVGFGVDVVDLARLVRCPALIVHAEHDAMVPLHEGRLLANLIPDSRFVQLNSENHMPLENEPSWARFVDEAQRFLSEPNVVATARDGLPLGELTPRERAVLEGIAEGLDNSEIATSLGLSEKTVRNHITRLFDKIGVEHRYQAIVRARDAGLGMNKRLAQSP